MKIAMLVVTGLILITAGCKPDGPRPAATPAASPTVDEQGSIRTVDAGLLSVDPAVIDLCKDADGIVASKVSWNASSLGTEGVEVWLQAPGEANTLWSADGAVGSSVTGEWMRDGSVVTLVNGEDDKVLAQIRVIAKPCATR